MPRVLDTRRAHLLSISTIFYNTVGVISCNTLQMSFVIESIVVKQTKYTKI